MTHDRWLGAEMRHFAALAAIASEGSFRGAARRLGYVQSAVSQQIAFLERLVGARLIERSPGPKPVFLTPVGELVCRHADQILAQINAAKTDVVKLSEGQAGTVRVGVFQSVATRVMPRILKRFARNWPNVAVIPTEYPTDAPIFELVAGGDLDLGFACLPLEPGPFGHCELLRTPQVLVVNSASPLADAERSPTLAEIAELPLIGRRTCRLLPQLEDRLRAERGSIDVVFRSDNHETAQTLVGVGIGAAVMPRLAVDAHDDRTTIVELEHTLSPTSITLFWHRERLLTLAAKNFSETARKICAEIAGELPSLVS